MSNDNFSNVISLCAERVKEAEADAYEARSEAIYSVIDDAEPWDVLSLMTWILGGVLAGVYDEHRDEVRRDMIEMIDSAAAEHDKIHAECEAEDQVGTKH